MEYQSIEASHDGDVTVLCLNRPDKMNALDAQMRAELTHAVKATGGSARAVVITGQGPAFCAGQDLGDAANAATLDLERTLVDEYEPMLKAIWEAGAPVIAAVNGAAVGAGANLALICDVVIAAESAFFSQAFSRIGLIPDAGGTWLLPRKIGLARSMGAAYFGDRIPATQAANWGMIWEAVPDEGFEAHWRGRAQTLASGPTQTFLATREALRHGMTASFDAQLAREASLQGAMGRTRDFSEGLLAFMEKRPPHFEGR